MKSIQLTDEEFRSLNNYLKLTEKLIQQYGKTKECLDKLLDPDNRELVDAQYIKDVQTPSSEADREEIIKKASEVAQIENTPLYKIMNDLTIDIDDFELINKHEVKVIKQQIKTRKKEANGESETVINKEE